MNVTRRAALALFAASFVFFSGTSNAASASLNGAFITKVQHDLSTTRGPNGRAYITIDRHFPLAGVCMYSGGVDAPSGWMLEFSVEHGSFKSMLALALTAYAAGHSVNLDYDDGFGPGTTCRITNLQIAE